MDTLLASVAVASVVYWLAVTLSALRAMKSVPLMEHIVPRAPIHWPRVSVIVPACNEADTLEAALRSRLDEDYPNAEYIVVNDRSTDGTGEIIERIAKEDPRVRPVHVEHLPDGWLGKLNAMNTGLAKATGEWILFSDADIHHEPRTLSRTIAHAEEHRIDHVAILPTFWSSTFWLDVVLNTFLRFAMAGSRAWKVSDPKSKVAIGGGLFALVRREALARAGGLEPLRLEVVDDAALGQMLKWSGARQAVLNGRGFVSLYYYRSLVEAIRGFEKNMFAIGRFAPVRFLLGIALVLTLELGVFVAPATTHGWLQVLAAIGIVLALGTQVAVSRWLARPTLPSLLAPLGMVILLATCLRSMVITLARGGIVWRGTHYPLAVLRRGMRFRLA